VVTSAGSLYIVATPIGNLADITLRAIETLKSVALIAAEDTRHSRRLLDHYQITTPTISLHEYNEQTRAQLLCDRLQQGENIALISDAGTPLISDPGYRLVDQVRQAGIRVVPIPGPCAAIAALVASGLPTDQFVFVGFLPAKGAARKKKLAALKNESRTIIFYESVHRMVDLIDLLNEIFEGERRATVARELTKTYETIYQATLSDIKHGLQKFPTQIKGEFVVVVQGAVEKENGDEMMMEYQRILEILLREIPLKQAVNLTCQITGARRKLLYSLALKLSK
jgi:16S rRNA (cytidine1402-2'-O)-methyltransferase